MRFLLFKYSQFLNIRINFFTSMSNFINQKEDANQSNKKSSGSQDAQQLIEQLEDNINQSHFEEPILSLTDPSLGNVVKLSNCSFKTEDEEKKVRENLKIKFQSANRILVKRNQRVMLAQFESRPDALELIENGFPGFNKDDIEMASIQDVKGFGERWIQQQSEAPKIEFLNENSKNLTNLQQVDDMEGKVQQDLKSNEILHQQILPKLNKITSMEAQFIREQEKQFGVQPKQYESINEEQSHQLIESRQDLEAQPAFIMHDPQQIPIREDKEAVVYTKQQPRKLILQQNSTRENNFLSFDQKKTIVNETNEEKMIPGYISNTQFYWIMVAVGFVLLLLF